MPLIQVMAGETAAERLRLFWQVVGTDGITPALGEAGGQPQVSVGGAAFSNTGIGVFTAVGNGRYYADLDPSVVVTAGTRIESRYKGSSTAECPGDVAVVVDFDPYENLSGNNVVDFVGPVNPITGDMTLIRGDAYLATDTPDRSLVYDVPVGGGNPNLSGAVVIAYWEGAGTQTPTLTKVCSVNNAGLSTQQVVIEPTDADTALLDEASYRVPVRATYSGSRPWTFLQIQCAVQPPKGA